MKRRTLLKQIGLGIPSLGLAQQLLAKKQSEQTWSNRHWKIYA
jgi:hypothetical protein